MIYIMRGIPGSGKSHKASTLNVRIVSADSYFTNQNGEYKFNPHKIVSAHNECIREFLRNIDMNIDMVVDNTNIHPWEISPYISLANAYNHEYEIINISCPVELAIKRNKHNVPENVIRRMDNDLKVITLPPFWNQR